jgi:transcriptional regulator with XRE-family HTH domain
MELAEAMDLSQAAISNLESGNRQIRVDELVTISRVLSEELDYFLAPTREQLIAGRRNASCGSRRSATTGLP